MNRDAIAVPGYESIGEYPRAERGPAPGKSGQTGTLRVMAPMVPPAGDKR